MRQKFITKCFRFFNTKSDKFYYNLRQLLKMHQFCYKMRQLLQLQSSLQNTSIHGVLTPLLYWWNQIYWVIRGFNWSTSSWDPLSFFFLFSSHLFWISLSFIFSFICFTWKCIYFLSLFRRKFSQHPLSSIS